MINWAMLTNYQKPFPRRPRAGFTPLELLIAVLIIGILASIALPAYTKVVEKSRATQALTLLHSLQQAFETYYLANGEYPSLFEQMDVNMKDWNGNEKWLSGGCTDTRSNGEWSLQIIHNTDHAGIYMGRISGVYKGAGFGSFGRSNKLPTKEILCIERTQYGVVFEKAPGDHCVKVLHSSGSPVSDSRENGRFYHMS